MNKKQEQAYEGIVDGHISSFTIGKNLMTKDVWEKTSMQDVRKAGDKIANELIELGLVRLRLEFTSHPDRIYEACSPDEIVRLRNEA